MTLRKYLACSAVALLAVILWLFPEVRPSIYPVSLWSLLILAAIMGAVYLGIFWLILRVGRHAIKGR
jgi:hypothetical protein